MNVFETFLTSTVCLGLWAFFLLMSCSRYAIHYYIMCIPSLAIVCLYYVHIQIGAQFERENEEDLKDQMDFMQLVEPMPGLCKCIANNLYMFCVVHLQHSSDQDLVAGCWFIMHSQKSCQPF